MCKTHWVWTSVAAAVLLIGILEVPAVRADEISLIVSQAKDLKEQAENLGPRYLKTASYKSPRYVAERLIEGENFYRSKDYQRAAVILMDIIENYSNHAAYPDALYFYADSLYLARDFLGAREWFHRLLDNKKLNISERYRQKAIERLIEIGIHLGDFQGIDRYFELLGSYSSPENAYIRAKYLYFKGNLDESRRVFETVDGDELLKLKALYMIGVILTRKGELEKALELFTRGQSFTSKTKEEQKVVDLIHLGAGRLYYEQGFVINASEAYQKIEQNSPYFDSALYEAASVLIGAGDAIRAEQTLEVLTIAVPDSKYIPRAKMLRGNLLLRTGRYDEAERMFEEVIAEFTPLMEQLDSVIEGQKDTRGFFYDLVEKNLETLNTGGVLPPMVVKWVGEEKEVARAIDVAGDLGTAKEYVKETEQLVELLEAVIEGANSVNAIPTLRIAMRRAQQMFNQLARLRIRLLKETDRRYAEVISEIASLRRERLNLEKQLASLPTEMAQFEQRENKAREVFIGMRKELSRNALRIDQLKAMVVAIERFVSDPRYADGVARDKINAATDELNRHRLAIEQMKKNLSQLTTDVESGRYLVGVGDINDRNDKKLQEKIRKLAEKERSVVGARGDEATERIERAFRAIDYVESIVARFARDVENEAIRQVAAMRDQVRQEKERVVQYHTELSTLSNQAEEVVGGVAFENFSNVKKRFQQLVLNADVGIIDVAWLKKEEHTSRISELTKSRLSEIKTLDDEFQEVKESDEE